MAGDLWRGKKQTAQPAEPTLQDCTSLAWLRAGLNWSPTVLQVGIVLQKVNARSTDSFLHSCFSP